MRPKDNTMAGQERKRKEEIPDPNSEVSLKIQQLLTPTH